MFWLQAKDARRVLWLLALVKSYPSWKLYLRMGLKMREDSWTVVVW